MGLDDGAAGEWWPDDRPWWEKLKDRMFGLREPANPFLFAGHALFYAFLVLTAVPFLATPMEAERMCAGFWHGPSLVFHEAGHFLFAPFGGVLRVLGGTLCQSLVPLVCLGAFLFYRNPFGASFGLWWFAYNLMDAAPYIADARSQTLRLLGGVTGRDVPGYHDWNNLLGRAGWLQYDRDIAMLFYGFGGVFMTAALIWGGYIVFVEGRSLKAKSGGGAADA